MAKKNATKTERSLFFRGNFRDLPLPYEVRFLLHFPDELSLLAAPALAGLFEVGFALDVPGKPLLLARFLEPPECGKVPLFRSSGLIFHLGLLLLYLIL